MEPVTQQMAGDRSLDGYSLYRGRCRELSEAACAADPALVLIRGHYYCPIWGTDEPHWWTMHRDGTIYDPTREQFPSKGHGIYTPFSGLVTCANCGKEMLEENADIEGNYAFCGYRCHGQFVGVL